MVGKRGGMTGVKKKLWNMRKLRKEKKCKEVLEDLKRYKNWI